MRGRGPLVIALTSAFLAAAAAGGDPPPPDFGGRLVSEWAGALADRATRADAKSRLFGGAIDAYAKLVGPDLRPTPFRDEDVEPVRAKYLARWGP